VFERKTIKYNTPLLIARLVEYMNHGCLCKIFLKGTELKNLIYCST